MKTEQEIRNKLEEISKKIDCIYHEFNNGNILSKDKNELLNILQIREDILEWVLEKTIK